MNKETTLVRVTKDSHRYFKKMKRETGMTVPEQVEDMVVMYKNYRKKHHVQKELAEAKEIFK